MCLMMLVFILKSVSSAFKNLDALYNALNYNILLLRIITIKCIKCIKQEHNTSIHLYTAGSQRENKHYLHFRFNDIDFSKKGTHFRMHSAIHDHQI